MDNKGSVDQIIAQAQQQVTARRAAAIERQWGGPWQWLLLFLVLAVLLVFIAAPAPLPRKLLLAMGGVCALRPAHSYFAGGVQLPMESRMIGIYGGFTLTLFVLLALGRLGARRLGSRLVIGVLALFFLSMAFDGINSTVTDLGLPHLYESTNVTRLLTGLISGTAIAPFLVWLLGLAAASRTGTTRPVVGSVWELGVPLVVNVAFAVLVMSERALFYNPIALISVGGVVGVLTMVALLVVLGMSGLDRHITRRGQVVAPAALALLIAFALLAGTAVVRWTLTGI